MKRITRKEIRRMIKEGEAVNLTFAKDKEYNDLVEKEGFWTQIYYSLGVYGRTGCVLKGGNTGTLYAIGDRTSALWLFD